MTTTTRKKQRAKDIPELYAGYCQYHECNLSYRKINRKGCMDPYKQCRHGNQDGVCRYLRKVKLHPVWELLEAIP